MHAPGSLVAGRYALSARLASGGMGDVWAAHDRVLDRPVAIKLIKAEFADDSVFRRRLVAEARAAAAVAGRHVVEIYDVGDSDGAEGHGPYIAMALVDGQPVRDLVARGPMPPEDAADLIAQVATALSAAHAAGVVHRDIKPANVMRDAVGNITVLDFGIARAADAAALTETGLLVGTARYMSPEQVSGAPATAASDVYSLGVVGYECLTGAPPFDGGSDVATALAHREQPVPPLPPSVPQGLAALIEACLAKNPADRPSAADVATTAASYAAPPVNDGATAVMPALMSPAAALPRWLEPRRIWGIAAGLLAVIAAATAIGFATDGSPSAKASSGSHKTTPPTHAPSHDTVMVRATRYLGEPYSLAAAQLTRRGLTPLATGPAVSPNGLISMVAPTGHLHRGAVVTLTVAATTTKPVRKAVTPAHKTVTPVPPPKPHEVPPGQAKKDKPKPKGK